MSYLSGNIETIQNLKHDYNELDVSTIYNIIENNLNIVDFSNFQNTLEDHDIYTAQGAITILSDLIGDELDTLELLEAENSIKLLKRDYNYNDLIELDLETLEVDEIDNYSLIWCLDEFINDSGIFA